MYFVSTPPKVFLVGQTTPNVARINDYIAFRGETFNTDLDDGDPMLIAEAAGRVCYMSFANPRGRQRSEYLQDSIIQHGHGSVLAHVWFNFMVGDLPRSTQIELVRHGVGTAFSFESTRFTNKHMRFVIPPRLRSAPQEAQDTFMAACRSAASTYDQLRKQALRDTDEGTLKRKRALEAARSVLPNALGSDGMFSCNSRALRHIISMRSDEHADLSIREFAIALYEEVSRHEWADAIFGDQIIRPDENEPDFYAIAFAHEKV